MPRLTSILEGFHFAVGFPLGLLDRMPAEDVLKWIEEKPEERASIVARLVNKSLLNDEALTACILTGRPMTPSATKRADSKRWPW